MVDVFLENFGSMMVPVKRLRDMQPFLHNESLE